MAEKRMLRFGAFMRPVTIHTGSWRYPGAYADANFNFKHIKRFAQTLERGRFDAFFMADHLSVLNMPMDALKRSATVTSFEPMTLLPALAMATDRLGLIATGSTPYDEPYHVARPFASPAPNSRRPDPQASEGNRSRETWLTRARRPSPRPTIRSSTSSTT